MPSKAAPKDARKRAKKPGKIADLPAKSLKGKDAAAVKGGMMKSTGVVADGFLKIDRASLKIQQTNLSGVAQRSSEDDPIGT